ncbi:MAG TPA: hypothetical protein VKA46_35760 [Gemmataceae bacterium]|nr:hypothetical protein [Gemmataceae bacterium]
MSPEELFDFEQRVGQLPPGEQMELIERLLRRLRQAYFTDHEALERGLREMAADPDVQRELNQRDEEPRHAAG